MPSSVDGLPGAVKGMTAATLASLIAASVYSVALGGNGLVWFAWVVLGLLTLGMVAAASE